jgi:hypothetical protein
MSINDSNIDPFIAFVSAFAFGAVIWGAGR